MAPRILFQLALFVLPFIMFGLYRLAITEAEQEGRKPWPIRLLFGAGLAMAVGSWLIFIVLDRGGREECYRPAQIVDGVVIPGERYPCEKDLGSLGLPRTDDPGGQAEGVGERRNFDGTPIEINDETAEPLDDPDGCLSSGGRHKKGDCRFGCGASGQRPLCWRVRPQYADGARS